jgi:alkylation response protein AidB-like acyl-CoA dehydrogenase
MDFELNEEQQMLADSVARFGREHCSFARWRERATVGEPFSRANWRRMAEMGWLGLTVGVAQGGVGGGPTDTLVVMEGIGAHLMLEPYVGSCVIAPALVPHAEPTLAHDILSAVVAGSATVALADAETNGRFDRFVAMRAERSGGGFVLTGRKSHVLDGAHADWFVIAARTAGEPEAEVGVTLFLVAKDTPGLSLSPSRAIDYRQNASLELGGAWLPRTAIIGEIGAGWPLLERARDLAICARLSEAVGAMTAAYDRALAYLRTRHQFGVPIGSFQVLQHRAVDMAMACEEARSFCALATLALDAEPAERRRIISSAKARVGQTSLFVGRQAIQLHGGVGFSDELDISHYLKRLIMIDMVFGNADHHRGVIARDLQACR